MSIALREATAWDKDFFFEVRNDPSVFPFCAQPRPVSSPEHDDWFANALKNTSLFVVMLLVNSCGTARIEKMDFGRGAELSLALLPEFRRAGLGTQAVALLREKCRAMGAKPYARVRSDNLASISVFLKNGVEIQCL